MMSIIKSRSRELILVGFILLICIVNTCLSETFLTSKNLMGILKSNTVYGILALGMAVVIATGNVDCSVGVTLVGTGVIASKLIILRFTQNSAINPVLAFLAAMAAGIVFGAFNGFFVAYVKIPSLIVTLASFNMIRGILCLVTGGRWITGYPGWFIMFANTKILGVNIGVIIWLALAIITALIMSKTTLGRNLLAVGGNPSAAMRVGINSTSMILFAYMYMGALTGIASILFFSQTGMLDPMLGSGYEMTVIASVIIGGTMLSGGTVSILGSVLGVLVLGVINSLLVFAHIPVYWQKLFTGALLLIAVSSSYVKPKHRTDNTSIRISAAAE